MTALAALILGCSIGATPPPEKREGPKPHERAAPGEPSPARRAALQSTLEKRRAYRDRFRGNALRQQSQATPYLQNMVMQAQRMAAAN
jgi:hypothetical protein